MDEHINIGILLVGASLSDKKHLMLNIFSRTHDLDFYLITKLPAERYSNSKIKIQELG